MLTRRDFVKTGLAGSSLIALGGTVPGFLASTAQAAEPAAERILVVVEMTGGNDGLNTVIPYGDDRYYRYRPTLAIPQKTVMTLNDHLGLHPSLLPLRSLVDQGQVAVLQGVGYPNPNRSHFESMDIWQTADPRRLHKDGWLGRSFSELKVRPGRIPAYHVAQDQLPLTLQGAAHAVPTVHPDKPFGLQLGGPSAPAESSIRGQRSLVKDKLRPDQVRRMDLIRELAEPSGTETNSMLNFVQRSELDTYATIDRLREIMSADFSRPDGEYQFSNGSYEMVEEGLVYELALVARMIQADLGARVYYVSIDGFDTHSDQLTAHQTLLQTLSQGISRLFMELTSTGHAEQVLLVTYSEFGRRVDENGSRGTDHGSGSCMFAVGPGVKGGPIGEHPSLEPDQLDNGDLKFHTDFRRVYATLLDRWLGCDSQQVLGEKFEPVEFLA